jgi:hypothetical protein
MDVEQIYLKFVEPGKANLGEGSVVSTVDLLIKVACFVKKCKEYFHFKNELV